MSKQSGNFADFTKVQRGPNWAWRYQGWESPDFPYLEDRPWTPLLVGGLPCFIASNDPHLNNDDDYVHFPARKWCVVWGDKVGRWYDDATNLSEYNEQPVYVAQQSFDGEYKYLIVHGSRESQLFDFQIDFLIDGGTLKAERFETYPRRGRKPEYFELTWHDIGRES